MNLHVITSVAIFYSTFKCVLLKYEEAKLHDTLSGHSVVAESKVFPYVVAIFKKSSYACAGALLDNKWVITAAAEFSSVTELTRVIRVRVGSINYKRGGVLLPAKMVEVHPLFKNGSPEYDIALILMATSVRFSPSIYPIKMQRTLRQVTATHFIVSGWTPALKQTSKSKRPKSMDVIKQQRMLSISHLHPSAPELCADQLSALEVNSTKHVMCLDPDFREDPCLRDVGAPVVLNDVLWGIVSSWRPGDCRHTSGPALVTLVAAQDVKTWVHATTTGQRWNRTARTDDGDSEDDDSNEVF